MREYCHQSAQVDAKYCSNILLSFSTYYMHAYNEQSSLDTSLVNSENFPNVSTRCSGLCQGKKDFSLFVLTKTKLSGRNVAKVSTC